MAVIDASALAGWLLPDEDGPDISILFDGQPIVAPWLLWVELRNILMMIERRGRIEPADTDTILQQVDKLGIVLDTSADSERVMALARRHRLTAYDSTYLELAIRRGEPLASLDKALIAAAKVEKVDMLRDAYNT
ncbi:type II toxin-antitoxin system VapC family toxin [uncultured Jannaschia sp.]|uniref:type II toxin-antitoxin system VapC family toxin n=1 Tax=uncultured Jannaschia sp. TaxID=293347 RepID=UPI002616A518|nr:type II toxin-antitoxin system VapC family toxin [uncultured Jannaschia sp.]